MKQPLFIKNTPIDEKRIAFIERVVTRLVRRSVKKIVALTTPYPISNAVFGDDVKGPILCYMFPCKGTITKCLIDVGRKLKEGATVNVSLTTQMYTDSKSYTVNKEFLAEPKISVCSGDKLIISINPNGEEKITEVWTSFLWVPSVKDVKVESYLIDKLDENVEEVKDALYEM